MESVSKHSRLRIISFVLLAAVVIGTQKHSVATSTPIGKVGKPRSRVRYVVVHSLPILTEKAKPDSVHKRVTVSGMERTSPAKTTQLGKVATPRITAPTGTNSLAKPAIAINTAAKIVV